MEQQRKKEGVNRIQVESHKRLIVEQAEEEKRETCSTNYDKRRRLGTAVETRASCKETEVPLLIYPARRGGTAIFANDIERLQGRVYLNDRIVNVMAAWAGENCLRQERRHKLQVCDSFLYTQLVRVTTPEELTGPSATLVENFKRVQGYRRQKGPGDREVTLIPICENNHWYLLALFLEKSTTGHQAVIFVLDSLPTASREHATNVLKWYMEDALDGPVRVLVRPLAIKQQENLYDCGLHVIHNIMRLSQFVDTHKSLVEEHLCEVLNTSPCPVSRIQVRDIINSLVQGQPLSPEPMTQKEVETTERKRDSESTDNNNDVPTDYKTEVEDIPSVDDQDVVVLEVPYGHLVSLDARTVLENQQVGTDWEVKNGDLVELIQVLTEAKQKLQQQPRGWRLRFLRQLGTSVVAFRLFKGTQFSRIIRK